MGTAESAATLYIQWKHLHNVCLMLGMLLIQLYLLSDDQLQVRSSFRVPQTCTLGAQVAVANYTHWTAESDSHL